MKTIIFARVSTNIQEYDRDKIELNGRENVKLTKTEEIKTGYKRK